jgi:hypothetical protein
MTNEAQAFLTQVEGWPEVKVNLNEFGRVATVTCGSRTMGRIDLVRSQVLIVMPQDAAIAQARRLRSARRQQDGVVLALCDASDALELLRRRVRIERFAPQFRDQSP